MGRHEYIYIFFEPYLIKPLSTDDDEKEKVQREFEGEASEAAMAEADDDEVGEEWVESGEGAMVVVAVIAAAATAAATGSGVELMEEKDETGELL